MVVKVGPDILFRRVVVLGSKPNLSIWVLEEDMVTDMVRGGQTYCYRDNDSAGFNNC